MKKAFFYLFAAMTLCSAVSCVKETIGDPCANTYNEGRVLCATFDNQGPATKTTLEGLTPKWAAGDAIRFTDGTNSLTVTLVASDPKEGQALISDGGAKFSVSIPDSWGSTIYAVSPASSFNSISSGKIRFTIPYNQDGSFARANICVAKTNDNTIAFKNAAAIVKVGSAEDDINYVSIPVRNIAGLFEVATPGDEPTVVSGKGVHKVLVNTSGAEHYAAVAPVTVEEGTWLLFEDADNTIVGAQKTSMPNVFYIGSLYDLGDVAKNDLLPEGMLRHAFTMSSDGRKSHFSKSNCVAVYNGESFDFSFFDEQFGCVGATSGNIDIFEGNLAVGDAFDYFGWVGASGSLPEYGITNDADDAKYGLTASEAIKADWGLAYGAASPWHTPSSGEFKYLYTTRVTETKGLAKNAHYALICADDHYGLLFFPDKFEWTSEMGDAPTDLDRADTPRNKIPQYTLKNYRAMEEAGCVFLYAAGFRHPTNADQIVQGINEKLYYWLGGTAAANKSGKGQATSINGQFLYDEGAGTNSINFARATTRKNFYCVRMTTY